MARSSRHTVEQVEECLNVAATARAHGDRAVAADMLTRAGEWRWWAAHDSANAWDVPAFRGRPVW